MTKNARNLILSLRRRERYTKGRIFERESICDAARWCFSHVEKMRLSLSSALSPPLDLCNYADEVLYTFAYLSLHQTLAFGSRCEQARVNSYVPKAAATAVRLDGDENLESFLRAAASRALRQSHCTKINPWSFWRNQGAPSTAHKFCECFFRQQSIFHPSFGNMQVKLKSVLSKYRSTISLIFISLRI